MLKPIVPDIWDVRGMMIGRVYLLRESDGYTLIDTSIAPSARRILKHLEGKTLKRILITHAHPDHVGGLFDVQKATGAEVMASALERRVIEAAIPIPTPKRADVGGLSKLFVPPKTFVKATPVSRELADGDRVGELQVISTPGHAPGHLAFWHPEKRVLFCGDVLFHMRGVTLPWAFLTVDMEEDKRSIQRLAQFSPEVICFGHGEPITQNATQRLRDFAKKVSPP